MTKSEWTHDENFMLYRHGKQPVVASTLQPDGDIPFGYILPVW